MDYTMKMVYDEDTATYSIELNGETLMECLSWEDAMTVSFGEAIRLLDMFEVAKR